MGVRSKEKFKKEKDSSREIILKAKYIYSVLPIKILLVIVEACVLESSLHNEYFHPFCCLMNPIFTRARFGLWRWPSLGLVVLNHQTLFLNSQLANCRVAISEPDRNNFTHNETSTKQVLTNEACSRNPLLIKLMLSRRSQAHAFEGFDNTERWICDFKHEFWLF